MFSFCFKCQFIPSTTSLVQTGDGSSRLCLWKNYTLAFHEFFSAMSTKETYFSNHINQKNCRKLQQNLLPWETLELDNCGIPGVKFRWNGNQSVSNIWVATMVRTRCNIECRPGSMCWVLCRLLWRSTVHWWCQPDSRSPSRYCFSPARDCCSLQPTPCSSYCASHLWKTHTHARTHLIELSSDDDIERWKKTFLCLFKNWRCCFHQVSLNQPLVNFALLVAQSDSDSSDIVKLEAWVVLMEIWSYPAHPNAAGLLTREDPNRVVVLRTERCSACSFHWNSAERQGIAKRAHFAQQYCTPFIIA